MIGPAPTDPMNEAVEQHLLQLLASALAGVSPSADTPDDAGAGTTNRKGLGHHKYHVVRLDGRDKVGETHHGCSLFVLDLTHDPAARAALIAYCAAAAAARPQLVRDLVDQYLEGD